VADVLRAMVRLFRWITSMLTPRHRFGSPNPLIKWCERVRTWAALAVVVLTTALYTGVSFHRTEDVAVISPMFNGVLALPALVLAMLVVVLAAGPDQRRRVVRALRRPIATAAAVVGAFLAVGAIVTITSRLHDYMFKNHFLISVLTLALMIIITLNFVVWAVPALAWTAYMSVRNWFNGADGHPLLPALSAIVFAVFQLGVNLFNLGPTRAGGAVADPQVPLWLRALVELGGPLVLAAAAAVEIRLLQNRGISLRVLPSEQRERGPRLRRDRWRWLEWI
jgi:hypothetical protein